ncbi:MAG: IscS subfamily cysteine desulfurase [Deltaproteobacteria bacterium RIFCSPLOWO2_02_FULL_50_16]|nr:MAG: IscS subfamily cysteine desulfurase [Deltaproteobacteria bacterium RIFCSPLOWO2_02_FULL_50_16]OGQ67313.1 MAG: IscS subfamily cysteine desulfurase [Deltaproteobacteria bacterium RIFCSPLOWO2_12_FULL_50_11]
MKLPIYMDHHATTPVDPQVFEVMQPYFSKDFGNAASRQHSFGWRAEEAVAIAREHIAHLIGAESGEIIFNSGATESINLALIGAAQQYQKKGRHIITVVTEHKAGLEACRYLQGQGFQVTYLPVNALGDIDLDQLSHAICDKTILMSVMAANNEIGTLAPLTEIGEMARKKGILFHTDAAQACGKIPLDVRSMGIDLLSMSAHKVYGPKGIGALYVRRRSPRIQLTPQIRGGAQEQGMRSGTLNVPGIVGMGKALELAKALMISESQRIGKLRDQLYQEITEGLEEVFLNGPPLNKRLYNNLNMSFGKVDGDALLMELREVAVSSDAACTTSAGEPSHVLKAIGVSKERAQASLRFGLGRENTTEEVRYVAGRVIEGVKKLRKKVPRPT